MTFEPGGAPRIPNQTPLPGQNLAAHPGAQSLQMDPSRVLFRVAFIHGALLVAAMLVVYVLRLVDPALGIWLILGVAGLTALHVVYTLRRIRSRAIAAAEAGHHGGEQWPQPPGAPLAARGGQGLRFEVEDVFSISGRGTVVTGSVAAGTVSVGQAVLITRGEEPIHGATVAGIEFFRRTVEVATAGDAGGLLLPEVSRSDVARGDVIVDAATKESGSVESP